MPDTSLDQVLAMADATHEEIAAAVQQAELPALLAALYVLTGDETLIDEALRPSTPVLVGPGAPQGGMAPAAVDQARVIAARVLERHKACWLASPAAFPGSVRKALQFMTCDAGSDILALLERELGLGAAEEPAVARAVANEPFRVAVIGTGFGGIAASYNLSKAGIEHTVFEKNAEVGGVWWNNTYPGCRLDTPNYAYSLTFAQKKDWPQQFSQRDEIFNYLSSIATSLQLRQRTRFQTEVVALRFQEGAEVWHVTTRQPSGEERTEVFNAVVGAAGHLNRPRIPDFPGRERFRGRQFHSAEWDHHADLKGQRVAVIGTGASAFQIVPAIVGEVGELKVFQRTAPWMLPTPTYHDDIKPGMMWLLRRVPYFGRWYRLWHFWVSDEGRFSASEVDPAWKHPVSISEKNERLRQTCLDNLRAQLAQRGRLDLLPTMTPGYAPTAKRQMRDNGVWVAALTQPHTTLVSCAVSHFEPDGVVDANGRKHELDVVIFATGFYASDYLDPIKTWGRGGVSLTQAWAGDPRAYLGLTVPGFPNLFILNGPNSSTVVNGSAPYILECGAEYSARALRYLVDHGHASLECTEDAYQDYVRRVDQENARRSWGQPQFATWYKGKNGRVVVAFPFPAHQYWVQTSRLVTEHYRFTAKPATAAAPARETGSLVAS
ncbi:flavin-containing monooxygenase [Pseudorhodoferax sp.]|uniref:flavin-containing monooxygenase n=1 Tax=Pseudorhodoferax sp. TaxID=1993553 RepID=UPI002DD694CE|nr:NAD(P)/FAD-dependent oxidoreductase [Pseudorhodoferax sp.]